MKPVYGQSVTVTGDVTPGGATLPDWSTVNVYVGRDASGSLLITGGGTVSSTYTWIGYSSDGVGDVLVSGPGTKLTANTWT